MAVNTIRPEVDRKNANPNKRVVAQKSMSDIVAEGRSAGAGASTTSFASGDLFKLEALAAMGQAVSPSEAATDEYRTPQHALEAYDRKEVAITEMPAIIAKLGIVSEEEVADMTPKQAFAALKSEIDEDNDEIDKALAKKEGLPANVEPFKEGKDYGKELKSVNAKNVSNIKVSLKAKSKVVAKVKTVKKKRKKVAKKVVKKKKAQYKNPLVEAPAPVSTPPTPTSTETVDIPDPITGEVKKYNKMADGSLVPIVVASKKEKTLNPPKSVQGSRLPTDGRQDSAVVASNQNTDSNSRNRISAKFDGSKWVVANGSKPVFSITASDAFPGKEEENDAMWQNKAYGEELASLCRLRGAAAVISDVYKGHVKLEAQKTVCDYESDIVEALENSDPSADTIVKQFYGDYPEESREVVALYNDATIKTTELATRIYATASNRFAKRENKKEAQFDDGVANVEKEIDQEPAAVMTPEAASESVETNKDDKNVVDLMAEVLAPIIAATEVWEVDDVIIQLKETFSNDEAVASFKGQLEEKIKQDSAREKVSIEEKSVEEQELNDAANDVAASKTAMRVTLRNVKASLNKLRSTYDKTTKGDKSDKLNARISVLTSELEVAKGDINKLVKERSARLRYPRAKKLAEKMEKIGIKTPVQDIMLYTDTQFAEKTKEVEGIVETVGTRKSSYNGEKLISGGMPTTSEAFTKTVKNPFRSSNPGFAG